MGPAAAAPAQVEPEKQGREGVAVGSEGRPVRGARVEARALGQAPLAEGAEGPREGAFRGGGGSLPEQVPDQGRGPAEGAEEGPAGGAEAQVDPYAGPGQGAQGPFIQVRQEVRDLGAGGEAHHGVLPFTAGAKSVRRARRARRARCSRWRTSSREIPRWQLISSVSQPSRSLSTKTDR